MWRICMTRACMMKAGMTKARRMKVVVALLLGAALSASATISAHAQYTDGVIKIGVLTDLSGLYADLAGPGSVTAAKLAVADFDAAAKGIKVEIIAGDHQNKPDVAASLANAWFDVDKVDAVVDLVNSGVALAVSEVGKAKNRAVLVSGAASSDLTG